MFSRVRGVPGRRKPCALGTVPGGRAWWPLNRFWGSQGSGQGDPGHCWLDLDGFVLAGPKTAFGRENAGEVLLGWPEVGAGVVRDVLSAGFGLGVWGGRECGLERLLRRSLPQDWHVRHTS